ncbi:alanine racemase [Persephonella sp.]
MLHRSWAEIDSKRLLENSKNIFNYVKKDILAVVKADAYGHGSVVVSKIFENLDYVKKLCVATSEEGKELREEGITKDILVLGGLLKEELDQFLEYRLQPVISDFSQLELIPDEFSIPIHLKFDTGMNRLGFNISELEKVLYLIKKKKIKIEGLMSHFPSADVDEELTESQIKKFKKIVDTFSKNSISPKYIHIQNSAGLIYECSYCNSVRIGISLYGEKPMEKFPISVKTVMSVKSKLISIKSLKKGDKVSYGGTFTADKNMKIGIVAFGYADGLPRNLSNKGYFIINNKRAKILGNVTMDMTIVDLSDIQNVNIGDDVLIIGKNGSEEISFNDLANLCETIPYEIMCRISKRVKRIIL